MPICARQFAFAACLTVGATAALAAAPSPSDGKTEPDAAKRGYVPAFTGYRAFADQPVIAWREANDTVGRIGGWQAYARESQGIVGGTNAVAPSILSPSPSSSPVPAKPAASPGSSDSHVKQ